MTDIFLWYYTEMASISFLKVQYGIWNPINGLSVPYTLMNVENESEKAM